MYDGISEVGKYSGRKKVLLDKGHMHTYIMTETAHVTHSKCMVLLPKVTLHATRYSHESSVDPLGLGVWEFRLSAGGLTVEGLESSIRSTVRHCLHVADMLFAQV